MPKTFKSSTRKLLFTMIDKYKDVKSDLNQKSTEKIRLLDSIVSLIGSINNEDEETKLKIVKTVKNLKNLENNELSSCETHYLEKISSMTDVSLKTLRRIKTEGSKNQGQWNTPGKKRPHAETVSNLDNFDISAILEPFIIHVGNSSSSSEESNEANSILSGV